MSKYPVLIISAVRLSESFKKRNEGVHEVSRTSGGRNGLWPRCLGRLRRVDISGCGLFSPYCQDGSEVLLFGHSVVILGLLVQRFILMFSLQCMWRCLRSLGCYWSRGGSCVAGDPSCIDC